MGNRPDGGVRLELWTADDLPVLHANNTPEMTEYLGGPEPEDALQPRHERYLRLNASGDARMFTIRVAGVDEPVGSVGYWKADWDDQAAWEAGWAVHPAHQGRGIATGAMRALLAGRIIHVDVWAYDLRAG